MQNESSSEVIETVAISSLAAASKTPFKTAVLITLGIGLARLGMFLVGAAVIVTLIFLAIKLF